jgi:hypothetical protein
MSHSKKELCDTHILTMQTFVIRSSYSILLIKDVRAAMQRSIYMLFYKQLSYKAENVV